MPDPTDRRRTSRSHRQQLRNLEVSGFGKIKNFDFPHKRATLVMLLRERFFGDRLWLPAPASQSLQHKSEWMPQCRINSIWNTTSRNWVGPSNLALAIALSDRDQKAGPKCRFHFIEKQPKVYLAWRHVAARGRHADSFLKDLVSLRNPTSPLTFINYLHTKGRLEAFINCRTFYPSRTEFNDYLRWVAGHFRNVCSYGEATVAVEPVTSGQYVTSLRIRSRSAAGYETIVTHEISSWRSAGCLIFPRFLVPLPTTRGCFIRAHYLDTIETLNLARPGARAAVYRRWAERC